MRQLGTARDHADGGRDHAKRYTERTKNAEGVTSTRFSVLGEKLRRGTSNQHDNESKLIDDFQHTSTIALHAPRSNYPQDTQTVSQRIAVEFDQAQPNCFSITTDHLRFLVETIELLGQFVEIGAYTVR